MEKLDKKQILKASFNSIVESLSDPTRLDCIMLIHDFEVSENNQLITEEICLENMNTLVDKRIVADYIPASNNDGVDSLDEHGQQITLNRDGKETITTKTLPIGFIKEVYIDDYFDNNGNSKRGLFAKCVLWNDDKYRDVTSLIKEWYDKGIKISSSVEYLYLNYNVLEGVEYIQSPIIYTGNAVLNSEDRNNYCKVEPAYSDAGILSLNDIRAFNKAINKAFNKINNEKEVVKPMEKTNAMFEYLKSINAISSGDYRYKIYSELEKVMIAEEYNAMYISNYNIYPTENYFLYSIDRWDNESEKWEYKLFKVTFTVDENDIMTVNYDGRTEMEYQGGLVEVQTSLNSKVKEVEILNGQIEEFKISVNAKDEEIKKLGEEKMGLTNKLNETNEVVISLNSKVSDLDKVIEGLNSKIEEMNPIVELHKQVEFDKAFNSLQEIYKDKFEKINALDIFELETTQELIKKSVNSQDKTSMFEINQLIVDNVKSTIKIEETEEVKSINSIIKPKKQDKVNFSDIYEEMCGIKR